MSKEQEGTVLRLEKKKEHSLHISKNILDQKEIMYPAYERALIALRGILESSAEWYRKTWTDRKYARGDPAQFRRSMDLYEYNSNIIAFCGGRGQGKTSAMRSFAQALEDWRSYKNKKNDNKALETLMKDADIDYVYAIPPIDPTVLEDKDSIMAMILSHLFYQAEEQWKNPPRELNETSRYYSSDDEEERHPWKDPSVQYAYTEAGKNELMRKFQNCFEEVRTLQKNSRGGADTLDALYQLGDSFDLKADFYDLLHQFFNLLGKNVKKSFLLIQLDDTDLQFTKAYEVLEETRKYLSLPNVIVVMATDVDQLRFLVAQHYYGELYLALEKKELDDAQVRVMAAKYLDKLIPVTHAIYLPNIRHSYETGQELSLEIADYSKDNRNNRSRNGATQREEEAGELTDLGDLQQAVFNLIYKKTGIVFIKHRFYIHNIVPRTLRGISHLYRLLDNMEPPGPPPLLGNPNATTETALTREIWLDYCEKRTRRAKLLMKNLLRFEDYFLNDWCSSRLIKEHWDLLREIQSEAIPAQSIPYTINLMLRPQREGTLRDFREGFLPQFNLDMLSLMRGSSQHSQQKQDNSQQKQYNYKTLNELIADLEQIGYTQADYAFGFALHTYFTIQFHKLALERQIRALNEQKDNLHERKDTWKWDKIFSFNYETIQRRLSPQAFDSEKIQENARSEIAPRDSRFPYKPFCFSVEPLRDLSDNPFIRQGEEGLYCDLLHVFYNSLRRPDNEIGSVTVFAQRAMLNMQDAGLYVCCNWDAQDQIIKALRSVRYRKAMEGNDICFPAEYANAFYAYILKYLKDKGAPSLPDSSGGFGVENGGREGFVWNYVYHLEIKSPYFAEFSPIPESKKRKGGKKTGSDNAFVSEEGMRNADGGKPDATREESS